MSEEAQGARNKDLKTIRENSARKCSRTETNEDLLHGLLVSPQEITSQKNFIIFKRSITTTDCS